MSLEMVSNEDEQSLLRRVIRKRSPRIIIIMGANNSSDISVIKKVLRVQEVGLSIITDSPERITEWNSAMMFKLGTAHYGGAENTSGYYRKTNLSLKQRKARKASKRARTMRKQMRRRNKK